MVKNKKFDLKEMVVGSLTVQVLWLTDALLQKKKILLIIRAVTLSVGAIREESFGGPYARGPPLENCTKFNPTNVIKCTM